MHGAIIADTLRTPWIPVKCYSNILEFKWQDWCGSLNMRYEPEILPEVWDAERFLSPKARLKNHVKRAGFKIGLGEGWMPPPPTRSTSSQIDALVERLVAIANTARSNLSEDLVFARALERLEEKLELFRNHDLAKQALDRTRNKSSIVKNFI
jgi:succinoglycan biosynthesis protein ExoV